MSEDGHLLRITTEETDVPLNPLQGADLILQAEVHDILFLVVIEAEHTHSIGNIDYDDISSLCYLARIIALIHPASRQVSPSMDPN